MTACGDHWQLEVSYVTTSTYSAICQVPPWGTNRGAVSRFFRSRMYSPFLLARQTLRELGEMESDPTGWLTVIVAPSQNGSSDGPMNEFIT